MRKYEPIAKKFYDGLDQGKILGMKCTECGHIEFPPYPACNNCGHVGNEWVDLTDEEVTIEEIYSISPMMTIEDFMPYAPLFSAECKMAGGIEVSCLIFGVKKKDYKEIREMVPLKGKLVVMPMNGFNSFAVAINNAKPARKEVPTAGIAQHDVLKMLSKEKGIEKGDTYKILLEAMGRKQNATLVMLIDKDKFTGTIDAMDMTVPIDNGVMTDNEINFSVEMKGAKLEFNGKITDSKINGTAKFGLMKMKFTGERQ